MGVADRQLDRAARAALTAVAIAAVLLAYAAAAQAASPVPLRAGWEVSDDPAGDAWRPARVPSVFDPVARPEDFPGSVKLYRLRFVAPAVEGYDWALRFEQVRRRATVTLNGRRIGASIDPYGPFQLPARGLLAGELNTLEVLVDNRRDPKLPEGWWNWGGIVRPVTLVPIGAAHVRDLGLMSEVSCSGPATGCRATVLADGVLEPLPRERRRTAVRDGRRVAPALPQPELAIRLRSPSGRVTRAVIALRGARSGRRRVQARMRVPAPELWSPERPQLYRARVELRYGGRVVQVERRAIGLRSVEVRDGALLLNNRPIDLRGASIHEDFAGAGAATRGSDMDTVVRELGELGANVTRAHYVLSEGLLRRLDRAGIMVYNQAPIWQRDRNGKLSLPVLRKRARAQVRRTVLAARSHPSAIAHSVANELAFRPDERPPTRAFLRGAARDARDLDPTIPIAIDIKTRPVLARQRAYEDFDLIGINQYFGWYPWVEDFAALEPFLTQMRRDYPRHALVMTEFGAEGRPEMAAAAADVKGSYAFQANHVARTLDLVDRLPFMSGAIHWTLREFEIHQGWRGGAVAGEQVNHDIRHHKGVLTYHGARKPAWSVLHDRFARRPLYR